jgi:hypothetical protein
LIEKTLLHGKESALPQNLSQRVLLLLPTLMKKDQLQRRDPRRQVKKNCALRVLAASATEDLALTPRVRNFLPYLDPMHVRSNP